MISETIDVQMGKKKSDVDCHFNRSHKKSGPAFQLVGFPDLAAAERDVLIERKFQWI